MVLLVLTVLKRTKKEYKALNGNFHAVWDIIIRLLISGGERGRAFYSLW